MHSFRSVSEVLNCSLLCELSFGFGGIALRLTEGGLECSRVNLKQQLPLPDEGTFG